MAILTSFFTLSLSSINLFYSQRLGRYPDIDPSLTMIAFTFPFIAFLIAGPLYSLVVTAAYCKGFVILVIFLIIVIHLLVLKIPYLEDKLYPDFSDLYGQYPMNSFQVEEETQEVNDSRNVLFTANFTAWISPCTVWANNFKCKSYFLIASSTICILSHLSCLISIYIFSFLIELSPTGNPPIAHCFANIEVQER